ncbi:MAG: 3-hydroxyacyl-CoA dehydrogenase family protein [Firmicutes bacterium]|nr:3-hydroxyacyl-CoA dehydrogenase family protein [Bacillota bacterium]
MEGERIAVVGAGVASNTSQFSITRLAAATQRPDRVCGMHVFNPPVLMNLVEIVRGRITSDETHRRVEEAARRMGKEAVTCKDSPAFITTRLIAALWAEAMRILEEGVAGAGDIDKACRLGLGHSMGPLETADWSGLNVAYAILESLRGHLGERFQTTATHRNLVYSGALGRKTGRGFYTYGSGSGEPSRPAPGSTMPGGR